MSYVCLTFFHRVKSFSFFFWKNDCPFFTAKHPLGGLGGRAVWVFLFLLLQKIIVYPYCSKADLFRERRLSRGLGFSFFAFAKNNCLPLLQQSRPFPRAPFVARFGFFFFCFCKK